MLYMIAIGFALSVGLLVLAAASFRPAQARPSKSRMVEMGLKGPFAKDAQVRRSFRMKEDRIRELRLAMLAGTWLGRRKVVRGGERLPTGRHVENR